MFKIKSPDGNVEDKELTKGEFISLYSKIVYETMNNNIDDGNEWAKWFYLYDDIDKTSIETMISVLQGLGYEIREEFGNEKVR